MKRIVAVTSRSLCRHVAERWHDQYGPRPANPNHAEIQKQLYALKKKGTKAEIDKIIGNETWTTALCEVCDRYVEAWVILGVDDYEPGMTVCGECLDDAVVEIENA